jgi:hypothetical protein
MRPLGGSITKEGGSARNHRTGQAQDLNAQPEAQ